MLRKADSQFYGDELNRILGTIDIDDQALTMLRSRGCSEYDIMRNASILSLIAIKSYDGECMKYGYNVTIRNLGTATENFYIDIDEMPVIKVSEDWHNGGYKILFINPDFIKSYDNNDMLMAVIKAHS